MELARAMATTAVISATGKTPHTPPAYVGTILPDTVVFNCDGQC